MKTLTQEVKSIHLILRLVYGLVPIVAGLDKFTNLLTNWGSYVSPRIASMLPISVTSLMYIVGVTEIVAGIMVLIRPKLGALIGTIWLTLIAVILIAGGQYFDVAVRDIVMAVGGYVLYRLSFHEEAFKTA